MEEGWKLSRLSFLKWAGALGGAAAVGGLTALEHSPFRPATASAEGETTVIPTTCGYNCGGRCLLRAHVRDGVIVRIESDVAPDEPGRPALRACLRGRSFRQLQYHPDRLKYPMKRVGKRGEGKWQRITWDEALDLMATQIKRINEKFGPYALYGLTATGIYGTTRGDTMIRRLLSVYCGDYLNAYGNYSFGQTWYATPMTYGTIICGNPRSDLQNSRLIILMGFNPTETIFGTNTAYYIRKAKEAGARIICVDPRYTDTAVSLADEWIPIRPSTDGALLDAMAYVMISENLHDQKFLDKYCLGFDEEHMPPGVPAGQSYKTYVMGQADGQPKTPEWAEQITGVPAARIRSLAREYATNKPGALIQGYGPQRHANGEQSARGSTMLPLMTGNLGQKGGSGGGFNYPANRDGMPVTSLGTVVVRGMPVPGKGAIKLPYFAWTEAVRRGKEMTAEKDLIQGAARLPSDIKAIFNIAGNSLVNQHADINRTIELLKDESKCEFIVTNDLFMTTSAQYSDLVLPASSTYEKVSVNLGGIGETLHYHNEVVKAPGECRSEYDWMTALAERLGVKEKFTEGRTMEEWCRWMLEPTAKAYPDWPGFDEFKKRGVFQAQDPGFDLPFRKQLADPEKNKFATPSGKIEIFSKRLYDRKDPEFVPAIPRYVPAFEGPGDPQIKKYPLQLTGFHHKTRVHSQHQNNPWMDETDSHAIWINPIDADARGIKHGDMVKVFNDRGATLVPARVTERIMPGVVAMPQGRWYKPGADGVDTNGSINVLTTQRPSYMSGSSPMHSVLVEMVKA